MKKITPAEIDQLLNSSALARKSPIEKALWAEAMLDQPTLVAAEAFLEELASEFPKVSGLRARLNSDLNHEGHVMEMLRGGRFGHYGTSACGARCEHEPSRALLSCEFPDDRSFRAASKRRMEMRDATPERALRAYRDEWTAQPPNPKPGKELSAGTAELTR